MIDAASINFLHEFKGVGFGLNLRPAPVEFFSARVGCNRYYADYD